MTDARETQEERRIRRAAHEWRALLSMPTVSDADRKRFDSWVGSDVRHEAAYDRAETLFQAMGSLDASRLGPEVMYRSRREKLRDLLHSPVTGKLSALRLAGAAVCLALCALLIVSLTSPEGNVSKPHPADVIVLTTATGEVQRFSLPDGSDVTLDAKSSLSTTFNADERRAVLISGAALFDVASDPDRPFLVEAGLLEISVRGTQFDVRNIGGVARVAVAEGEVAVSHPEGVEGAATPGRQNESLTSGQKIAAMPSTGLGKIEAVAIGVVGAWRDKRLVYAGVTLQELVEDAKRYAGLSVTIVDDSAALHTQKVSAYFDADDIEGMIDTLPYILPVKVRRTRAGAFEIHPAG